MKNRDEVRLHHVLDAIEQIEEYASSPKYKKYVHDEILTDAIIRQFSIIGEAVNHLSDEFQKENPKIDYRGAISMRNFMVHEYPNVDLKIVWNAVQEDLPKLKKNVKEILG